jgi:hypothetical protein
MEDIKKLIKPEFYAKLRKLGLVRKFKRSWLNPGWDKVPFNSKADEAEYVAIYKENCLSADSFEYFMEFAFYWQETPEGHKFWDRVAFGGKP